MTALAAAAAILVLFDGAASSSVVSALAFEITLMTAGAEWGVLGRGIRKCGIHATAVAAAASWIDSVVSRIVALRVVAEAGRRPARCDMTHVALYGRGQVIRRLEGRSAARIVTVIASADGAVVVDPGAANEGRRGMTGVAIQGGRQVGGIGLGIHSDRRRAVVAGNAIVDDAGMVEGCRDESVGVMADAAILIGRNMVNGFGRSEAGVVT